MTVHTLSTTHTRSNGDNGGQRAEFVDIPVTFERCAPDIGGVTQPNSGSAPMTVAAARPSPADLHPVILGPCRCQCGALVVWCGLAWHGVPRLLDMPLYADAHRCPGKAVVSA